MKPFQKLLLATAGTGLLAPLGVSASELNFAGVDQYASQEQVTSISQFSDVQPTDWAYQALSNLIERYGCVAGYPDGTYRGQRAMTRFEAAALLNACLPNRTAVVRRLLEAGVERVWVVGSGWEGDYSLEDSLAAGAVASAAIELAVAPHRGVDLGNDEMLAALALWQQWHSDPETCLRAASHGKRLIALGDHDADFACCSAVDTLTIVPTQSEPGVLRAG